MGLKNLLYRSVYKEVSPYIISDILKTARKNNKQKNITGVLFVGNGFFMQSLEGEEEDVKALFEKIKVDERHSNVKIIGFSELKERRFKSWDMAYIDTKVISDFYQKKVEDMDVCIESEMCNLFAELIKKVGSG